MARTTIVAPLLRIRGLMSLLDSWVSKAQGDRDNARTSRAFSGTELRQSTLY
jgi:hypothetical protein